MQVLDACHAVNKVLKGCLTKRWKPLALHAGIDEKEKEKGKKKRGKKEKAQST